MTDSLGRNNTCDSRLQTSEKGQKGLAERTRSASSESMALHATMTARRVKQAAQIAVTQPTSRSFLRLPRDSIGNLFMTNPESTNTLGLSMA